MTDRIDELFARLYTEAIYSSSASATKRDMNDDLECIEAALAEAIAERDALQADNQRLTERNTALEAVIAPLEKLLDALDLSVDPDPCDLDHHGLCQAHGCGDMGDRDTPHCPTAVVHEQMEKLRPALDALCAAPTPPKEEQ